MIDRLKLAGVAAAAMALASATASAAPAAYASHANPVDPRLADPDYPFTRPNPDAEIGKLANGVAYGVMRRAGTRQVSIILYVGAGSMDETDSERGVAHFLEHMAFNGSKNFPPGTVMKDFADIGVSIGRDQDAETGFDNTTYSLDISEITPERLNLGFSWLRDVADGLLILPSQKCINHERMNWYGLLRRFGFAGTDHAADNRPRYVDQILGEVDVSPFQAKQLTLAQSSRSSKQNQRSFPDR